ncbi:MAG TPA: thioredoxin [Candidatus Limnocylindrales bacterium]|nr:thioredoxin [Candidatus Limnocylindrales bacterium]
MSKPIHVTTANFEELVLLSEQAVIVDFYADWCGPCKMVAPILEQIGNERSDVTIAKVNVDEEPALAERYRVRGIPYLALFREGKLAKQVVGYQPKAALEANLGLVRVAN